MTDSQKPDVSDLLPETDLAPTAALLEAQIAVGAALSAGAVEPAGLDEGIADLLVRLSQRPSGLRGVDLARQLMTNPTRISRIVDRAESRGLVRRSADPRDRRAQILHLTPAGEEALLDYAPRMMQVLKQVVFEEFTAKELQSLVALLNRLRDAAEGMTRHRLPTEKQESGE